MIKWGSSLAMLGIYNTGLLNTAVKGRLLLFLVLMSLLFFHLIIGVAERAICRTVKPLLWSTLGPLPNCVHFYVCLTAQMLSVVKIVYRQKKVTNAETNRQPFVDETAASHRVGDKRLGEFAH